MNPNKTVTHFLFFLMCLQGYVCAAKAAETKSIGSESVESESVKIASATFSHYLVKAGEGQASISVSDFNADGNQDIIIANYSDDNIIAYQGNGKGGLTEAGRFPVGANPTGMDVADINGDDNIDIAVANHETSYVTLLFGDGKGSFKPAPQSPFTINIKPHPHVVRLNDLDGDNKVDLIVDSRDNEGLLVLKGLANGRFKTPGKIINAGGDPYRGFAVRDFNGDGYLDLATPNQRDIGIVSSTGKNDMSFSLNKLAQSESPFAVELAEMNGDGKVDLVIATNGRLITVIPGDGRGNFLGDKKTIITASSGAKQIAVGDINGDGIEDALVSNWSGNLIAILGGKTTFETFNFEHSSIPNPWGIALADLNRDGKSDFIVADGDSSLVAVYVSQSKR